MSATLWTVAHQVPLSMEYWSGLLCPPPGDLLNLGIKPTSLMCPALAGVFFTTSATWEVLSGKLSCYNELTSSFLLKIHQLITLYWQFYQIRDKKTASAFLIKENEAQLLMFFINYRMFLPPFPSFCSLSALLILYHSSSCTCTEC